MYGLSARYYDAIYEQMKDYGQEAERVRDLAASRARREVRRLLDVACGTGLHLEHLRNHFEVEGLELAPPMIEIARERLPGIRIHEGDMAGFKLPDRFDVVTCLFSAIGYMTSQERLERAVASFARHLEPGGVAMIEPWILPESWRDGYLGMDAVDRDDLKLARFAASRREGDLSHHLFHYAVLDRESYRTFDEEHVLRLASRDDYEAAFRRAGLEVEFVPEGLMGRGLFLGVKPD